MTEEDKKLISKYMGWSENPYWWCEKCKEEKSPHHVTYVERCSDCGCPVIVKEDYSFDSNSAAICVKEMQKRGDWRKVTDWTVYQTNQHLPGVRKGNIYYYDANFIAYLFNAENFFKAFCEWRKSL